MYYNISSLFYSILPIIKIKFISADNYIIIYYH